MGERRCKKCMDDEVRNMQGNEKQYYMRFGRVKACEMIWGCERYDVLGM